MVAAVQRMGWLLLTFCGRRGLNWAVEVEFLLENKPKGENGCESDGTQRLFGLVDQ